MKIKNVLQFTNYIYPFFKEIYFIFHIFYLNEIYI
jgi:hypothetical protein